VPSALIKAYAKQSGRSVEHCEKIWEDNKKEADSKFHVKKDSDKDGKYWAWVNATTRHKLGLDKKTHTKHKVNKH
jgi:hypothetical protein